MSNRVSFIHGNTFTLVWYLRVKISAYVIALLKNTRLVREGFLVKNTLAYYNRALTIFVVDAIVKCSGCPL